MGCVCDRTASGISHNMYILWVFSIMQTSPNVSELYQKPCICDGTISNVSNMATSPPPRSNITMKIVPMLYMDFLMFPEDIMPEHSVVCPDCLPELRCPACLQVSSPTQNKSHFYSSIDSKRIPVGWSGLFLHQQTKDTRRRQTPPEYDANNFGVCSCP